MIIYIFEQRGEETKQITTFDVDTNNIGFNFMELKDLIGLTKGIKAIKLIIEK